MYNAGSNCRWLVNIDQGTHCQLGDDNFACSTGETLSGCGSGTAASNQHTIVLQWLLPWLDLHLHENASAVNDINQLEQNPTGYTVTKACTNLDVANVKPSDYIVASDPNGSFNLTLTNPLLIGSRYVLTSMDGKVVETGAVTSGVQHIGTNLAANGVYMLQIDGCASIQKLVVTR
jgi:hypothetical protein